MSTDGPSPSTSPGDSQSYIEVEPHALLRVAAWPIETLDPFTAPELAGRASALTTAEVAITFRAGSLCDDVHDVVPKVARGTRRWLLAVRRTLHAGVEPFDPPDDDVAADLTAVAPELLARLTAEAAARADHAAAVDQFTRHHAEALDRERHALRDAAADHRFLRALAVANPDVAARWAHIVERPLDDRSRTRRLEGTAFSYLVRASSRAMPQGAWAGVVQVDPDASDTGAGTVTARPAAACYEVTVDLQPFAMIFGWLSMQPAAMRAGRLRINPTLRPDDQGWRYLGAGENGITWLQLGRTPAVAAVVAWWEDGSTRPASGFLDSMHLAPERRQEAAQFLEQLVNHGVLQVAADFPLAETTPWRALEVAADSLCDEHRPMWTQTVATIRQACDELAVGFDDAEPAAVLAAVDAIGAMVERFWTECGLPDQPPAPLLHVDMRSPWSVSWSNAARAAARETVRSVLDFHAGDGAAEQYRKLAVARVVDAAGGHREVDVLDLLAAAPPRRKITEFTDTRDTLITRLAPDDPIIGLAVDAGCRRWTERLHGHQRDAVVRLDRDDVIPDGAVAGPGGDLLFTLTENGPAWAPWGRPQPGMFLGRLASLLDTGAGATGLVADLEARARRWAERGVTMAEIVGRDPANRNVALRPDTTPVRLDAWGDGDTWLHGLRAIIDPTENRITVRSERWPGVVLPLYSSLATIGGLDPGSLLLRTLSMGQGWEWVAMAFPALPVEREDWHHLPRLELADGTVISPRRWTVDGAELAEVIGLTGADRYLAWRRLADRAGMPARVNVRWDVNPNAPPLLLCGDSPLAVDALFDRVDAGAPRLVVTETPEGAGSSPIVDAEGRHYAAELAVTWWDESWPEVASARAPELHESVH